MSYFHGGANADPLGRLGLRVELASPCVSSSPSRILVVRASDGEVLVDARGGPRLDALAGSPDAWKRSARRLVRSDALVDALVGARVDRAAFEAAFDGAIEEIRARMARAGEAAARIPARAPAPEASGEETVYRRPRREGRVQVFVT